MTGDEFDPTVFMKGISVLLVDEDGLSAKLTKDTLSTFGFENINHVQDEMLIEGALSEKHYGVIITDWKSGEVDVSRLIKKMREDKRSPNRFTPVLMITGRGAIKDVKAARDMGVTEFMLKPLSVPTLRDKLIEIIERPRNFIISRNFTGPDRRRKKMKVENDRRNNDDE